MKRHGIDVASIANYGREGVNGFVETPFGKIPEFKYCAVKLTKGGEVAKMMGYGTNTPSEPELISNA